MVETQTSTSATGAARSGGRVVRGRLACAVVAGPVFAVVSLAQALTRPGFDLTRNPLSVLSNGSLGWLQITNFLLAGALTVAGATGLRRALRGTPGGVWAPRLVAVNGIGMMAAGVFRMDPADGFPAGTPLGRPAGMSWHSDLHMACSTVAFVALIVACLVLGRHFATGGRRGYAVASGAAGLAFAAGVGWAMSGGTAGALTLGAGAIVAMLWVSVVAARLRAGAVTPGR